MVTHLIRYGAAMQARTPGNVQALAAVLPEAVCDLMLSCPGWIPLVTPELATLRCGAAACSDGASQDILGAHGLMIIRVRHAH